MDKFLKLSLLTKANAIAIFVFGAIALLGHSFMKHAYVLSKYGVALLVAQALTTALNDPESETPLPLWLRAAVGYGVGILFWIGLFAIDFFVTSHLIYQVK